MSSLSDGSVEKTFVHVLEELVIVSVIYSEANQHRARDLKRFLQCLSNLMGSLDHKADSSKGLGILDDVHRPKVDT